MRGIKYRYLSAILYFLYHGEVDIFQEDIDEFLMIAEELEVRGLTRGSSVDGDEKYIVTNQPSPKSPPVSKSDLKPIIENIFEEFTNGEPTSLKPYTNIGIESSNNTANNTERMVAKLHNKDYTILDQQIQSMMERMSNGWKCQVCEKLSDKRCHIISHIEANHFEAGSNECNECGKILKTRQCLRMHHYRNHRN